MQENLNDLRSFLAVVKLGSFTKAAAQLGITQSAVSHAVRGLEDRLKVKLLHRTTRSIAPTPAGEQLYQNLSQLFAEIDHSLANLNAFRESLTGKLRINGNDHVFNYVLGDKFLQFMQTYPDIQLELITDNRFTDVVAEQFDAGIRFGDDVAKDMVAVRISDDLSMVTVASPSYSTRYNLPHIPAQLLEHSCLQFRLPRNGGIMAWEFFDPKQTHKTIKVQPNGQFISNNAQLLLSYARQGLGIAWLPLEMAQPYIETGELQEILTDYRITYPAYHLYYPSRHLHSPLFQALIEFLKIPS